MLENAPVLVLAAPIGVPSMAPPFTSIALKVDVPVLVILPVIVFPLRFTLLLISICPVPLGASVIFALEVLLLILLPPMVI